MFLPFYYLVVPFVIAALLIKWLKKNAPSLIPEDIKLLCAERPIQKKWFRALKRDHKGLRVLGDFETHGEAVESAYAGRKEALASKEKASFLALNWQADTLEQIDS